VVTNKGNGELDVCNTMLDHGARRLKRTRRVTFLADRGFRDRAWARTCRTQGWDYIIRSANNTTMTVPSGVVATAETLNSTPGQRRYLPHMRVTLEAD
jgi:hypothetical protein